MEGEGGRDVACGVQDGSVRSEDLDVVCVDTVTTTLARRSRNVGSVNAAGGGQTSDKVQRGEGCGMRGAGRLRSLGCGVRGRRDNDSHTQKSQCRLCKCCRRRPDLGQIAATSDKVLQP